MAEGRITEGFNKTTQETEKAKNSVDNLEKSLNLLGKTLGKLEGSFKILKTVEQQNSKGMKNTTKILEYYNEQLQKTFKITAKGTTRQKTSNLTVTKVEETPKGLADEQEKLNKKTSKFGILLERIKRIAVYRIIRRGLQIVTQTFTQSIQRLAQFDEKTNESVSQITSAFTKMQNAVGVAFVPILQSLAPVIDSISNSIVNFSNQLSLANAKLTGQDKYLKANTDYWKDYAKSIKNTNSQLLSFDKFEVLSSNKDGNIEDMFSEETITGEEKLNAGIENLAKTLNNIPNILSNIYGIASKIFTEIIEPLLPYLSEVIRKVIDVVSWIIEALDNLGLIKGAIYGIITLGAITKLTKLIKALGSIKSLIGAIGIAISVMNISAIIDQWQKWNENSKAVAGGILLITIALTALAVSVYAASKQWGKAIAVGGTVLAAGTTVALGLGNLISGYEQGGIPEKSELYYMNEYGKPEAMMSTNGQTNVINQDQLKFMTKEGFKEAIYETGLLDVMQERIVLDGRNIDNNYVARGLFNALKVESTRRGGNQL